MSDKDFITQVREHRVKNKCSITDAMRAVARKDPDSHQAYLKSGPKDFTSHDDQNKDFMALVKDYQKLHSCSRTDAMRVIVKRYPHKHRAYVDSANN